MTATKEKQQARIAFTVDAAHFAQRLACVSGMISRRSTIPVLTCVLIEVRADRGFISASNLDQMGEAEFKMDAPGKAGAFCVDAAKLSEFVRRVSGPLSIEVSGGSVKLKAGSARAEIYTLPAGDFAKLTFSDDGGALRFSSKEFAAGLSLVFYAVSREEVRYYLRGVRMTQTGDGVSLHATDGKRLAMIDLTAEIATSQKPDFGAVIIPRETIPLCIAACERAEESVYVSVFEGRIKLSSESEVFISKLIDGLFPDVERAYPKGDGVALRMPADDLLRAVDLAASAAEGRDNAVIIESEDGRLICTSRTDGAFSEATIEAPGIREVPRFFINGKYLSEALAACKGGEVALRHFGEGAPIRVDGGRAGIRQAVMPIRG